MKARVKLVDGMMFVGESGSGHSVVMDGAPEYGGRNLGIRPMEMLLIGLGGCTAFDVVQILRKGREQVSDCEVEVTAERAEVDPKVFTKIHLEYRVAGKDLAPAKVERAIQLSKEKYCSASIMLGAVAEITHSWTALDEAAEPEAAS
jgi:putative redox protein